MLDRVKQFEYDYAVKSAREAYALVIHRMEILVKDLERDRDRFEDLVEHEEQQRHLKPEEVLGWTIDKLVGVPENNVRLFSSTAMRVTAARVRLDPIE